jgi:cell division protein FtsN
VASNGLPPASAGNGTLPSNEPRKIRTLSVKGDQPDASATPVGAPPPAKPTPATRSVAAAANANASANTPLSLAPQPGQPVPAPVAEPRARVAATNPAANPEPTASAPAAAGASGGYLVQVSSQRNEADAQASFKALQGKFPAVLGSRSPVIKRADLGDKGVYYRALVGPFGSSDEAAQWCGSLKTAGGQCIIQRN